MLPLVGVPETLRHGLAPYREVCCRAAGFDHISRYVTGLLLRPPKTLPGIDDVQVWEPGAPRRRRAMHEAVVEASGDAEGLMPRPREVVAGAHHGQGREVIRRDWTYAQHERGLQMWGGKKAWDHVEHRLVPDQTVVTAVSAHRGRLAGIEGPGQQPAHCEEDRADLPEPGRERYAPRNEGRGRWWEWLPHYRQRLGDPKRPARAVAIVKPLEAAGHFPQAPYAFDHGGLRLELPRGIAQAGKHGVSALERSRHRHGQGPWQRGAAVAAARRCAPPDRFRPGRVRCRHGETKSFWAFTNVVRRKRYGRQRLVIVHDQADRSDAPRGLLSDARHGESGRVMETWSYRWASEIFQECGQQVCGLEAAQVRQAEAVKRHCRLRGVAPSLLQQAPASGAETERCACAQGAITIGQKVRTRARDALQSLLQLVEPLFAQGHCCEHILEVLMPA
jgi:hypothetical protein